MKPLLPLLCLALLPFCSLAAVAEGENLLINGRFDAEQVEFPEFWTRSANGVRYQRAGGPEGQKPAVILAQDASQARTISVRQQGLTLVPGETYKLSAYIKTKGFKCHGGGVIIHNSGWTSEVGLKNLPADSDWKFYEKTFQLIPSKTPEYGLAIFATGLSGEAAFADLKLEAVSPAARAGSRSQMTLLAAARLVPWQPLLNRIPRANPQITFRLFGNLPEKPEQCEVVAALAGNPIPPQTLRFEDSRVVAQFPGLAAGDYTLNLAVRRADKVLLEAAYPISLLDAPALDLARVKPLNNLVSEVLNEPVEKSTAPQNFTFVNPRDGWVFVSLSAPALFLAVTIDGNPVITAAAPRLEAFRELSAGTHRLAISGVASPTRVIVRSIPEIFDYPPCVDSAVKGNGNYNWDFMKRHILPAVTTLNGGSLKDDALREAKSMGLKWLANFNVAPVDDPANVRARMEKHAGLTQPQYDGFTSDELFFGRATTDNYTKALWQLRNPERRLIYSWVVGKPSIPALHTDLISAILNASHGRGRMLFEAYCHPQPDEKSAAAYLDDMLNETMRRFNATFPNAAAGTGIIFGNFNQIPTISLESDPSVDFKYFLDMQVHRIANSPDFTNLATTGYWGTYYGDEEMVRWSFLLMRHYAVEGQRDMLSARYGFKYNPALLANPDFVDGLNAWTATPAASGSIRPETIAGYGKNSQGRWGAGKAGDAACLFTRQPGEPNRLTQTAAGLVPGKTYCLQFVTADRRDLASKKFNPRRYGLEAELPGAEIIPDKSFVHIDRRHETRGKQNDHLGKINLHRVVFRPKTATQPILFIDASAAPGDQLLLNFVQLKPYLDQAQH